MFKSLVSAVCALFLLAAAPVFAMGGDMENTLYMDVKGGRVVIVLRPDVAPNHVARIKKLTREKFYNGLKFHRVLEGFMAQTGDPQGNGSGGSSYPNLKAEFSKVPFERGVLGMARSASVDSANSQFFICTGDASWLTGDYTVFGQVASGMEYIDELKKGTRVSNGMMKDPDIIIRMQVAADVK